MSHLLPPGLYDVTIQEATQPTSLRVILFLPFLTPVSPLLALLFLSLQYIWNLHLFMLHYHLPSSKPHLSSALQ